MTALLDVAPEARAVAQGHVAMLRRIGQTPSAEWLALAGESADKPDTIEAIKQEERAKATKEAKTELARIRSGQPTLGAVRFFDTIEPEKVDWLWRGYLPIGKLAILDGDPGLGKSTVAIDIAARISRGLPMPDGSQGIKPSVVLLSSAEDGLADTLRPRLDAAGADVSKVAVLPDGLMLPDCIDVLRLHIEEHRARLVILDPLMSFLAGRLKANSDQDVRQALGPLAQLAEDTGCTVLVIRHLRKSDSSTAIYRGGGSIGIIGQARVGLAVARDPDDDDRRVLMVTKSNLAAMPSSLSFGLSQWTGTNGIESSKVEWFGASDRTADDLLTMQEGKPAKPSERPHERAGKALRKAVQEAGGSIKGTDALAALAEQGYEYDQSGYAVTRLRLEAGVSTKQVGSREGSFSLWFIEDDEGSRPVLSIEGATRKVET